VPPLEVEFSPRFRAGVRALPPGRQLQVEQAVTLLVETLGKPHVYSGLGLRRLRRDYFEFRAGKDTRVVFKLTGSTASLVLVGDHDDVRQFLKNR
jgi:mRNA-degrading endonuclease RelE of RelBE toxin-antitoxin system